MLFSGKGGAEGYRVDLSIILPGLAVTLAVVGLLSWKTMQLRRSPVRTGLESMVGQSARVVAGFSGASDAGTVLIQGEYWNAVGPPDLADGDTVRVQKIHDGTIHVERRKS